MLVSFDPLSSEVVVGNQKGRHRFIDICVVVGISRLGDFRTFCIRSKIVVDSCFVSV